MSNGWGRRDLTLAAAIHRVQEEVRLFGGNGLRIDTDMPTRNDGLPYSQARMPDDPGAVVSFHLPGGKPVIFPCDRYSHVEQNLAAIAATLNAKRAIERHGVSTIEREFEGYAAIPSNTMPHPGDAPRLPHEILGVAPGAPLEVVRAAHKALALKHHPDRGGNPARMAEINAAAEVILGAVP